MRNLPRVNYGEDALVQKYLKNRDRHSVFEDSASDENIEEKVEEEEKRERPEQRVAKKLQKAMPNKPFFTIFDYPDLVYQYVAPPKRFRHRVPKKRTNHCRKYRP